MMRDTKKLDVQQDSDIAMRDTMQLDTQLDAYIVMRDTKHLDAQLDADIAMRDTKKLDTSRMHTTRTGAPSSWTLPRLMLTAR